MLEEKEFLAAVDSGRIDMIKESLYKSLCQMDCRDENGRTALMLAACHNHKDVVDVLVSHSCIAVVWMHKLIRVRRH